MRASHCHAFSRASDHTAAKAAGKSLATSHAASVVARIQASSRGGASRPSTAGANEGRTCLTDDVSTVSDFVMQAANCNRARWSSGVTV